MSEDGTEAAGGGPVQGAGEGNQPGHRLQPASGLFLRGGPECSDSFLPLSTGLISFLSPSPPPSLTPTPLTQSTPRSKR